VVSFDRDWAVVLASLYLPGTPHGLSLDRRAWPRVISSLRRENVSIVDAERTLRVGGLFAEAAALSSPTALVWGEATYQSDSCLTSLCPGYPSRWLEMLGQDAPPAVWRLGEPQSALPSVSVVGSREIEPRIHRFCAACAREAVSMGCQVVSGGAVGCDTAALDAASAASGSTISILPYGLGQFRGESPSGRVLLSLSELDEPFSRKRAMERNLLIYAASPTTIVGAARYREGGTWHGAMEAIRRRITQLAVRPTDYDDDESSRRAARALVSLGARYLEKPSSLHRLFAEEPPQSQYSLFKAG
jgi:predicted Rossmann fold nucleotide-binding protein DprA/Smf involved in DNA uptake